MTKVMVLVPTYNEAENVTPMVQTLLALPIDGLEIMVVDDNSPDGTGQIADALAGEHPGRVHVLHRMEKEGLGQAYKAGFRKAIEMGADLIAQMDCDFSHPPDKLPVMVDRAADYDIVLGSRYARGGSLDTAWGWERKLLSWWANRVYIWTILRTHTRDATGGYKVWNRRVLQGLDLDRVHSSGYIFQAEMIYVAEKLGYSVFEVPIHFKEREHGQSKLDWRVNREAALRVWEVWWRHRRLTPADRLPVPD